MMKNRRKDSSGFMVGLSISTAIVAAALVVAGVMIINNKSEIGVADDSVPAFVTDETSAVSETAKTENEDTGALGSETAAGEDITTTAGETTTEAETTTTTAETTTAAETTTTTAETTTAAETTTTTAETTTAAETTTTIAETATAATTSSATALASSYDPAFFSNDMFIGDSIYTGLYLYDFFPQSRVFAKVGLNPQSARTSDIGGYTAAGKAGELKPVHIFIMLGTNGLAYMGASYMADNMKGLVSELLAASPGSTVYIVSIPPVTYAHELAGQETMAMVNEYNGLLKSAAGECGAEYIDLCSQLLDENGYFSSLYAEADGLHFLGSAYRKMLSVFQNRVGG